MVSTFYHGKTSNYFFIYESLWGPVVRHIRVHEPVAPTVHLGGTKMIFFIRSVMSIIMTIHFSNDVLKLLFRERIYNRHLHGEQPRIHVSASYRPCNPVQDCH